MKWNSFQSVGISSQSLVELLVNVLNYLFLFNLINITIILFVQDFYCCPDAYVNEPQKDQTPREREKRSLKVENGE